MFCFKYQGDGIISLMPFVRLPFSPSLLQGVFGQHSTLCPVSSTHVPSNRFVPKQGWQQVDICVLALKQIHLLEFPSIVKEVLAGPPRASRLGSLKPELTADLTPKLLCQPLLAPLSSCPAPNAQL